MSVVSSLSSLNISPEMMGVNDAQSRNMSPKLGSGGMTFTLPTSIEQPKLDIGTSSPAAYDGTSPTTWGQSIRQMVLDVNQAQTTAGEKVKDVMAGGKTTIDEAMVAVQDSNIRFQFLAELRTQAVSAYQQVMQMQV